VSDFWTSGGPVINLDHVVSVDRTVDDKLRVGTVCPGLTVMLDGEPARLFLNAIGRRIAEREAAAERTNRIARRSWWRAIVDRMRRTRHT
jgi:hypothetical protein